MIELMMQRCDVAPRTLVDAVLERRQADRLAHGDRLPHLDQRRRKLSDFRSRPRIWVRPRERLEASGRGVAKVNGQIPHVP